MIEREKENRGTASGPRKSVGGPYKETRVLALGVNPATVVFGFLLAT
jgi:hypothetical protein